MSDSDGFRMPSAQELLAAGAYANSMPTAHELLAMGGGPSSLGGVPVAPETGEFEAIPINDDEDDADQGGYDNPSGRAAPISLIPTATTNPKRPRTLAAGYDSKLRTLTVIFRDGTLYNYYEVSPLEWGNFKRARSKGRFILAYLDDHPRGYPTEGSISEFGQQMLSSLALEYQAESGGRQYGHSPKSRRGLRPYRR